MNQEQLTLLLRELPHGVLCSSDGAGNVNAAVFGSAQLLADGQLVLGLGKNLTLKNLQRNPKATYVAYRVGNPIINSEGVRLYLELECFETTGPRFEKTIDSIEKQAGKFAARQTKTVAVFKINSIRPLIDIHQTSG